jgi:hypothetical protein
MTDPEDAFSDLPMVYTPLTHERRPLSWLLPTTALVGLGQLLSFLGVFVLASPPPALQPLATVSWILIPAFNLGDLCLSIASLIVGRGAQRVVAVVCLCLLAVEIAAVVYFLVNFRIAF